MFSPASKKIVMSTVPAVAQLGTKLTSTFYRNMFTNHPELKNLFNMTHQQSGEQPEALFGSIVAFVQNIDTGLPRPVVEKIAHKHCSLLVEPAQYDVVGGQLLGAIDELLHPGSAVLDAWGEAYGVLAKTLIDREMELYAENEAAPGGWKGQRDFHVAEKRPESAEVTSFLLAPTDQQQIKSFEPGQYISLFVDPPASEYQAVRQYSLSAAAHNLGTYRISVKRVREGLVSQYMHNNVKEGDVVKASAPYGDFTLRSCDPVDRPIVLISSGAGITPVLGMLQTLIKDHSPRKVLWLHEDRHGDVHPFREYLILTAKDHSNIDRRVWYRRPQSSDIKGEHYHFEGDMSLQDVLPLVNPSAEFYLCGGVDFMRRIYVEILGQEIPKSQIFYENFGPNPPL